MINTINEMMFQRGIGVVYLDDAANIIEKDCNADEILSSTSSFWRNSKQFFCDDKAVKEKILNYIGHKEVPTSSAKFYIRKKYDKSPISLSIFPVVDNVSHASGARSRWLMLVRDTERKPNLSSQSMAQFYGLTNAEISLVAAIYQGVSLTDYAEHRGVKISTVRWTLDNIFSKTYTHSQSELLELANKFV